MSGRNVVIGAIVATGIVAGIGVAIVSLRPGLSRRADESDAGRVSASERPDALARIETRLAQVEDRLAALLASRSTAGPGEGESAPVAQNERLAAIESVLSALQTRVGGLEEDPVRRGFAYVKSENAELRREGVNLLDEIARFDPEARAALRSLLHDPSPRVREQAAQKLRDLGDKESVSEMAALLSDADPRTRRRAIQALGACVATDVAGEIGRVLVADSDDQVRAEAAGVLGRLGSPAATEFLTEALKDPNDAVRGEAIAALGQLGATSAAPTLRAIYDQDPGHNRLRLALTLKSLGDDAPLQREVAQLSEIARSGADEGAREQAIRDLAIIARDASRPVFSAALEDPSPAVRRAAERALR